MNENAHPSLKDRVVIVTGGGRGLGREMALALAGAGARVTVTGSRAAGEIEAVVEQAADMPGEILPLKADVGNYESCEAVRDGTVQAFGRVDCLINNAGRGLLAVNPNYVEKPTRFYEHPVSGWEEIVTTNVLGPFNMAHVCAPGMVEQGFGKIINISTSDVTMVRKGYSPYGPTKAALEACSRIWAADLEGTGVDVNVLLPGGATDTAILPEMENKRGSDGMLLEPAIMRGPALWLCSDASNGRTGERYIARLWDETLPPDDAAAKARDAHHEKPGIM